MYGAERSLLLLLKNIDRTRIEPVVIIPKDGPLRGKIQNLNIKMYQIRSPWWVSKWWASKTYLMYLAYCVIFEIISLHKFHRVIKREKIDAIYTNTVVNFSGALSAFFSKKPHIWHIREILLPRNSDLHFFMPRKILYKQVLKLSEKVIVNSNATMRQFKGLKQNTRVMVIYNAIEGMERPCSPATFLDINGLKNDDWIAAVVGALRKGKAPDDAIRAIEIAGKIISNVKLLFLGDGHRKYTNYLKRLTSKLEISDKVVFAGYRDDVPKILQGCKVLLIPSLRESFGRTAVEAMFAGIPVIASRSGALKEVIEDGATGYLVPPKDYSNIAEKIVELYHHPDLAKQMGERGRKTAKEKFGPGRYVQAIESVILEATNKSCCFNSEKSDGTKEGHKTSDMNVERI
jgi:glycosyltransferase involved in cell wall biosynthesis